MRRTHHAGGVGGDRDRPPVPGAPVRVTLIDRNNVPPCPLAPTLAR
jgi:hypothetical protein